MMKFVLTSMLIFMLTVTVSAQDIPKVSSGKIERLSSFNSKYVDERNIDVWLPDNYNKDTKYDVVYMHDGQMLFDSLQTWNKKEWQVDETVSQLMKNHKISNCIVIGIWNNGKYRFSEYFPQKYLSTVSEKYKNEYTAAYLQNKPQSDNYLRFIVEELKPLIDRKYSTKTKKESTFIMGSSMGGMISMYAVSEYPDVFGGAGCLSIAWVSRHEKNFELPLSAFNYLQKNAPSPLDHKIYMDHGTTEMDTMYTNYQNFVDEIFRDKGYSNAQFKSLIFEKTGHNENDWAKRLAIPFVFLLGKE
jgi:predicted alpha/beta superfamily hydrolase